MFGQPKAQTNPVPPQNFCAFPSRSKLRRTHGRAPFELNVGSHGRGVIRQTMPSVDRPPNPDLPPCTGGNANRSWTVETGHGFIRDLGDHDDCVAAHRCQKLQVGQPQDRQSTTRGVGQLAQPKCESATGSRNRTAGFPHREKFGRKIGHAPTSNDKGARLCEVVNWACRACCADIAGHSVTLRLKRSDTL